MCAAAISAIAKHTGRLTVGQATDFAAVADTRVREWRRRRLQRDLGATVPHHECLVLPSTHTDLVLCCMAHFRRILLCSAILTTIAGHCVARQALEAASLEQLPQAWLEDSDRPLTLAALRGQRIVLTMAYATCHRICPMTVDALRRMQGRADARAEPVIFLIVSYDPANDTPAVWHRYRLARRLDRPNWHFLTGSIADTKQLARQLGFPFWIYDGHVMHESHAVVFDARGLQQAVLDSHVSHWSDTL
jgi:protein SCO1